MGKKPACACRPPASRADLPSGTGHRHSLQPSRPRRNQDHYELTSQHVRTQFRGSIVSAQTSTLIGAETGIKTIAAVHIQCLSWVLVV